MERGHGDDQQALKDYDDFFRITPEFSELPSYLRFVRDLRLWKRVTEAAELAAKVGLTEDFSSDLEYSKLHQKADEDIEKEQSAAAYVARGDMWINESNPSLAQADFKKALELSPNDPNLRTKLARAYLTEYKWSEAMNELNQAIAADPNNAEAYYRRAQCESANPNATSDAEKACELKPDNVDYWKLLDSSYREAARYTDALRVVKKLQELVPADGVRYLKIEQAEYHQELGQWSEAAALLKEVDMPEEASKSETIADIFKSLPEPTSDNVNQIAEQYQKIVEIMTSLYRMQSAFRMLNQLVQKEPYSQSARLYGLLGKLYLQESNTTAAKENYQKAVQLDPNNPEWIVGELEATRIYDLDSEQLQEHFQKAMKVAQLGGVASGYFWSNIIQYANYEKKYDVALKAHDELVKIENTEVNWTMRGVFCEDSLKNNEEALKSYIKACEISPQDENTWNNRALILNKLGDHTEAFRCAQKAIELNPAYANPYAAVAMVYLSQGKLLEAKEYAEKSIQVDSQVPRGYFVLGQIMEQKQQFHDAQDNYQKFLNIGHPDPDLMQAGQDGLSRCENRIALEQQSASSKYDDHHYHLFLSHYQRTGGLLAMVLKLLLEQSDPTLKIFLDVDDLENIHDLKANVRNSDTVALLITEGVFERRFVIEEITTALELGKTIILIWDKERCPWPDPKTVPDHLQQVLLVRAIIWNAEKDFRNVVVHQIQSKIARTDHPQNPPTQQPQPVQAQAAVSTEQFELIKSSIQQQYDSFAKIIQQALAQQTQMFLQLQSDFNQLQAKVETISSTPATPQGSAPATPAPAPAATSSPAPAPSAPVTVTTPAPAPSEAPKSEQVQPTPEPTPQPAPVQQQQQNVASAEPQPEPAIEPASETPQPKSEPAPVQQEQNVRTSFGSTDDSSAKPRSETTSSPLVKPRTATTSTPATQVKQTYTMEGWLHKLGGWNKTKWESRYFTCDGQIMIYHSSQQIIQTSSPKGSIHLKDIISVEEVAFDVYKVNCCFAVQVPSKKYFFYADDEMAKMKWIAALRKKPT